MIYELIYRVWYPFNGPTIRFGPFEAKYGLDLEAHIARINFEFSRTEKPKKEIKVRERVRLEIRHCRICYGRHSLPTAKIHFTRKNTRVLMRWLCPTRSEWVTERIQISEKGEPK